MARSAGPSLVLIAKGVAMSKVTPIRRKGAGGPPAAGAHIDSASYALLVETLAGFLELRIWCGSPRRHCLCRSNLVPQKGCKAAPGTLWHI